MNKKVKLLVIFNCISYILMAIVTYGIMNDLIMKLSNSVKFILGSMPYVLIICTSFMLASDSQKEFKCIKKEAIFDFVIRIIFFVIIMKFSNNFKGIALPFLFIAIAFMVNTIVEYRINKKVINIKREINKEPIVEIAHNEKCNLRSMIKAINLAMLSILVFSGLALSVPINKNMEGTKIGYIPVIISILVTIWFISTNYNNYTGFYLDKKYAKRIFIRDIAFAVTGYAICLISAFLSLSYDLYAYSFVAGVVFLLPTIETMRKMSLRLGLIRRSLGKDTYNSILIKMK